MTSPVSDEMIEAGRTEAFNQAHRTYGDMCRAIYLAMKAKEEAADTTDCSALNLRVPATYEPSDQFPADEVERLLQHLEEQTQRRRTTSITDDEIRLLRGAIRNGDER